MWPQQILPESHQLILGGLFVFLPLSYRDRLFCPGQKVGLGWRGGHISLMIEVNLSKSLKSLQVSVKIDPYHLVSHFSPP